MRGEIVLRVHDAPEQLTIPSTPLSIFTNHNVVHLRSDYYDVVPRASFSKILWSDDRLNAMPNVLGSRLVQEPPRES